MLKGPLYDFVDEPHVPAFKRAAVKEYEDHLNLADRRPVKFEREYLEYLKAAHGRALRNCWFRLGQRSYPIDRIFSFARPEDLPGAPQPSWRPGADDVRLDYSVPHLGGMPNWAEDGVVVPFGGVGVNEMMEYDMLCFHFGFTPRPLIVLWEHEANAYEFKQVQFVARDFTEFTRMVFARAEKVRKR